jgi:hypothetical protein
VATGAGATYAGVELMVTRGSVVQAVRAAAAHSKRMSGVFIVDLPVFDPTMLRTRPRARLRRDGSHATRRSG